MNRTTWFVLGALATVPLAGSAHAASPGAGDGVEQDRRPEPAESGRRGAKPFWTSLHGGYQLVDLTTFRVQNRDKFSADLVPTTASGPVGQLAAGVRWLGFSLGARGTVMSLAHVEGGGLGGGNLWSIDGELGLHIDAGPDLDPYLVLGGGYTAIGGLHPRGLNAEVDVRGYNAHGGLGLDYFVADNWAIGILALGQVLFVTRPGVSTADLLTQQEVETIGEARARALEADGSSVGTALSVLVGPSMHF